MQTGRVVAKPVKQPSCKAASYLSLSLFEACTEKININKRAGILAVPNTLSTITNRLDNLINIFLICR